METLRSCDELIAEINNLPDPDVGYELLRLIEERERIANNIPTQN